MNQPIVRLFMVVVVLFAGLAGATSWWTVVKADELREEKPGQNPRALLRGLKVRRGVIRAEDGTLLARSVRDEEGNFSRRYPEGGLFAHAVGYSFVGRGQTGLEAQYNEALAGEDKDGITTLFDELSGKRPDGEDMTTTLDAQAQRVAIQALAGRKGSVVALDPRTGAVKVMVSTPGYDPNEVRTQARFNAFNRDPASPLLNLATQAGDPPGSTFKVVTAVAAIDSGKYEPGSRVNGRNGKPISGVPLNNFGQADYGDITLTEALTRSVNTVWAQVGEDLGKDTMAEYMERFGFGKDPQLDYPDGQMLPSGPYRDGKRISPRSRFVDVGRMAIGQSLLRVSPMQMALVASAVANGGELMKPHLLDRIVDGDGRTTEEVEPEVQERVMKAETAAKVTEMMASVVREGSGTAAALAGIEVAGKTGTAEKNIEQRINQPWFIGFAPRSAPKYVVAATIEQSVGGTGGDVAAPIAKQVLQELLG
ncbi:MAG: penicillin-binding protein 2 [Solirubrobacterales bacterium]|nr:penicillin-binding protein 2 [Solirubrobacterales bacterium]